MSNQLQKMKEWKDKGASFILQDDVAKFLGGNGNADYNHPLFDPTIDFILLLKNVFVAQSQDMSMTLEVQGIPTQYDPKYFENIHLAAGAEASGRNPHFPTEIRKKMADYFEDMDGQRQRFSTVDKLADDVEYKLFEKDKKGKTVKRSLLHSILDKLVKANLKTAAPRIDDQPRQKQTLLSRVREVAGKIAASTKPQEESDQKKPVWKFSNPFRRKSTNIAADHEVHKPVQQTPQQHIETAKRTAEVKRDEAAKTQDMKFFGGKSSRIKNPPVQTKSEDKTKQDLFSSAQIDKTVKDNKDQKKQDTPPLLKTAVKVAIQQNVIEQTQQTQVQTSAASKTNTVIDQQKGKMDAQKKSDARVSKMNMDDAVKLLQNSGVKTTAEVAKPQAQKDLENLQPQNPNKDKQRV